MALSASVKLNILPHAEHIIGQVGDPCPRTSGIFNSRLEDFQDPTKVKSEVLESIYFYDARQYEPGSGNLL